MANFGRRQVGAPGGSSTLSGYGSETFGDAGQAAWARANQGLDRAAELAIAANRDRMERQRQEEDAQREAVAKAEQAQRDAKAAEDAATMNEQLEATRKRMSEPGYVSPEGKPVDVGQTASVIASKTDPKFRTQVAEQRTKIADDEIKREEKLREQGLKDSAQVTDRNEKIQNKALNEVERFERAVDSRDARVQRLEQLQIAQQTRALIDQERQEVAQLRRSIAMDDKVEQARNVYEDDARVYQKAVSQVQMNAKENGVKLSKDEIEEQARIRMEDIRRQSGWYVDDGQGGLIFNGEQSPARMNLEGREPIDVQSYHRQVTPDEVARAKEIRYVMPRSMRDWKPGAWKAAGVDEATAIRMATLGSMQAGRDATTAPAPAASGRKEPVAANTASAGVGMSNSRPAPAPKPRPAAKPPAPTLAGPTSPGGGPASGPRPGPTPSSTAPAGPSSPAKPGLAFGLAGPSMDTIGAIAQAPFDALGGAAAALGQKANELVGWEDPQKLAKESDPGYRDLRDKEERIAEVMAGAKRRGQAGLGGAQVTMTRDEAAKIVAQQMAEEQKKSDAVTAKIDATVAKVRKQAGPEAAERVRYSQEVQALGVPRAKAYQRMRQVAAEEYAKTGDWKASQERAREEGLLLVKNLRQQEIGKKLGAEAEEADAAYSGIIDTLSDGKKFGRMMLETGIPMAIATFSGAGLAAAGVQAGARMAMARIAVQTLGGAASNAALQQIFDGKVDYYDAAVEGLTGSLEAPLVDALKGVGKKVGNELVKKALQSAAGAAGESVEEVYQTNLASLIKDRRFAGKAESAQAAFFGGTMGAAAGPLVAGSGKATASTAADPGAATVPEIQGPAPMQGPAEPTYPDPAAEPGQGNLLPPGGVVVSAEDQAAMTGAYPDPSEEAAPAQPVPTEEEVTAALETDAVTLAPESPAFQAAPAGEEVAPPAELDGLIPGQKWTKTDERTHSTTIQTPTGPVQLDVQLNEDGLTMTAADLQATRGVSEVAPGQEVQGTYTEGRRVNLTKRDLVRTLRGTGVATKAHEVLHFLRANGLISAQDWATMKAKYGAKAKAAYAGDWAALPDSSPDPAVTTKENLIEEAAADGFGGFARARLALRTAPAPVKAFARVYEYLHSAGSRLVGGNAAVFDSLLRGKYAQDAPGAQPAARPATQSTPAKPEVAGPADAPVRAQEASGDELSQADEEARVAAAEAQNEQALAREAKRAARSKKPKPTAQDVREKAAARKGPVTKASVGKTVTVYRGSETADKGPFWTTDRARAASYGKGEVEAVEVPQDVFLRGQAEAKRQGQPTGKDTVLGREWDARAKVEKAEADVVEVSDEGDSDDFLASLGVTRASVGKKPAADTGSLKARFMAARAKNKRAAFLSPLTEDELDDRDISLNEDGTVGYTLTKGDRDFGNLFNNSTEKGAGRKAIIEGIKKGARTLDAFDGFLPDLYRKYGFVETARLKFDPAQAPAGWETDPDLSKKPDVVFMVYRGGDRATIEDRVGKFEATPKAKRVRTYDAAKASQNARQDIVAIRENPPAKTVSMDEAKDQIERQNTDLSGLPRKQQLKIMVKAAIKELQYQMKQRRSGAGWYRGDIRELEHAAKKAFPELANPEQMGIFKALVAATSFGNKPGPNLEQAFQIYDHFRKTGELMGRQRSVATTGPEGPGQFVIQKNWSGGPAFGYKSPASMAKGSEIGSTEDKLRKLKQIFGSWGAVADFLAGDHTVRELKDIGFENVEGKLDDVVAGGSVLGPKGGPFMQNITGNLGDLTGDMWFARTFNRLRGTKIVDAPRNPSERALMRDFIDQVAKQMGVSPADAQAMLWFSEKDLYGKLVGGEDFGTFSVSARQALESMRNKRELDEVGIAPARKSNVKAEVNVTPGWSADSTLNETFDLGSISAEQAKQFTESHGKWVLEEVELETGATVTPVVKDGEVSAKIEGTADQTRAAAALVGLGLQRDAVPYGKDSWDSVSNDWKKNPKGEGYREVLDDLGHSPEGLDEFGARVATNRAEAWAAATTPTRASVGPAKKPGKFSATVRAATKPIIKRLREIKSVGGRPIGTFLADQLEARRQAYEMTAGRMVSRYTEAVGSLRGEGDWSKVQGALDGVAGAKGALNPAELAAYTEIRKILNEVKGMAVREDVFTGQGIREYFPHMAEDGTFNDDHAIQAHLDHLIAEDQARLQKLAEENEAWTGLVGSADNLELAAIDLARNWNKESFFKSNPHLEKFRSAKPAIKYRKDADVIPKYILGAVRRIMDARYLGSKSEVIQQGVRSIRDRSDQDYVKKALREILGGKDGHLGTDIVKELNTLNGLSKLGSAGLAQLTQLVVATSEMGGASGIRGALVDIAKGAYAMARSRQLLYREAARSGASFAADSGEAMRNFAGTGSNSYAEKAHRALWRALGLGSRKLEFMVDTTYGVKTLDKFARVMADRWGRETYLRALENGDRTLLAELLGNETRADQALKEDKPRLKQLRATWETGGTDPLLNDRATLAAGSRLALAGKRFADKTQYRTDTQDQPLLFAHPVMKAANTFYSFAYAHWRWNAEHIQAGNAARKAGDLQTARRHARALVLQHMITGPIAGAAVIALRSLLTGKGTEEKDEDDIRSFAEAWNAAMNLDTIGSDKFWTAHTMVAKFLQGWQYSGGLGYPMSYVERASRAAKDYDRTRGLVSFALGSPGEMGVDIGTLALDAYAYATNPSKRTQKAATRSFYNVLFTHTLPNVLGLSSALRRKLTATEERPNRSLGWLGLFDPQARWTKEHGWTSSEAEAAREEALEKRREAEERAAEEE